VNNQGTCHGSRFLSPTIISVATDPMQTLNRYVIHATSEGKPHTAAWDCYSRVQAVQMFTAASLWSDTVVNSVDELGPVAELSPDWTLWG